MSAFEPWISRHKISEIECLVPDMKRDHLLLKA